jgi:hydrogenase expression/formation protein HypE
MNQSGQVALIHGEGGRAMRSFIRDFIAHRLGADQVQLGRDAAQLTGLAEPVAITTDSYVVTPLLFPGGDIGSLAVHGTVNDLAVSGFEPRYLSLSLVLEEGLSLSVLDRVLRSVADAATRCGVQIVTGDTKVVPKGAADGLFINTTGIGVGSQPPPRGPEAITAATAILVSGDIGRHGVAVLCERESLGFDPAPRTDSAPLHELTAGLQRGLGSDLIAMRDATRGGLAAVLHEWAESSGTAAWIDESRVPVDAMIRGVCETLGLDPMFIANEGRLVAAVAPHRADTAIEILRSFPHSAGASWIGEFHPRSGSPVLIRRGIGVDQPLDEPFSAMLPRIC